MEGQLYLYNSFQTQVFSTIHNYTVAQTSKKIPLDTKKIPVRDHDGVRLLVHWNGAGPKGGNLIALKSF